MQSKTNKATEGIQDRQLPRQRRLRRPRFFRPKTIVLAKGALDNETRVGLVERICRAYPRAKIVEQLDTPANRVRVEGANPFVRHREGKQTLVLGTQLNAVRSTPDDNRACAPYWYFSAYGHCPYGCKYCHLGGARTVWFSPAVKIYVNLEEIMSQIESAAANLVKPTAFVSGKLQDGLALDPLTGYSRSLIPFFAAHRYARQIVVTKSDAVENLLDIDHGGNTILCWSLNLPEVARSHETNVPNMAARIGAMKRCAEQGYRIRALIQPVIQCKEWEERYVGFIRQLLKEVPLERLSFGGVYLNPRVLYLIKRKLGRHYEAFKAQQKTDGNCRSGMHYTQRYCEAHYERLTNAALNARENIEIGPCHVL